jgi:predicted transcriptional regulator
METVDDLILRVGIGPTELSKVAGIGTVTLYRYRKGLGKPHVAQLVKLADALRVSPERLAKVIAHSAAS